MRTFQIQTISKSILNTFCKPQQVRAKCTQIKYLLHDNSINNRKNETKRLLSTGYNHNNNNLMLMDLPKHNPPGIFKFISTLFEVYFKMRALDPNFNMEDLRKGICKVLFFRLNFKSFKI
jgi:hypothetical protein